MTTEPRELVLLYDGLCGFCDGTVQFILARDRKAQLKFATLQGAYARDLLNRHTELATVDSLILIERRGGGESILVRSAAVIALGRYLGGAWWILSQVLRLVPSFVRDAAYDAFARRRFRVFGRREVCRIPSPAERARFVD